MLVDIVLILFFLAVSFGVSEFADRHDRATATRLRNERRGE